jgi:hypothetical protein
VGQLNLCENAKSDVTTNTNTKKRDELLSHPGPPATSARWGKHSTTVKPHPSSSWHSLWLKYFPEDTLKDVSSGWGAHNLPPQHRRRQLARTSSSKTIRFSGWSASILQDEDICNCGRHPLLCFNSSLRREGELDKTSDLPINPTFELQTSANI